MRTGRAHFFLMLEAIRSTPFGFICWILDVVANPFYWAASRPSPSSSTAAPVPSAPGQTRTPQDAGGLRRPFDRFEDTVERCCAATAPAPTQLRCSCRLTDVLSDFSTGLLSGAFSVVIAVFTWFCLCCSLCARVSVAAGRLVDGPSATSPSTTTLDREEPPKPPKSRRAGRGGPLSHLVADPSTL